MYTGAGAQRIDSKTGNEEDYPCIRCTVSIQHGTLVRVRE